MTPANPVDRHARGAAVEGAALAYLQALGLRELAANANYRGGELDLVMLEQAGSRGDATVVFVEVRYRSHPGFGGGAVSIDAGKRRRVVHAAQLFLLAHRQYADAPCRFDVIDASGDPCAPRLIWLRDAFRADDPG
jgi:putative endonuclease